MDVVERILYDKRSAAQALSVSVRMLEYLVERGEIKVRRCGKRVLFSRSELERLARRDVASPSPAKV